MTNAQVRYAFMQHFAAKDYCGTGCTADDFLSDANKVYLAPDDHEDFCGMMCFANAAVVKAKQPIYDWCARFVADKLGFRCLDVAQAAEFCRELAKHGYSMRGGQGFVPEMNIKRTAPEIAYPIQTFERTSVDGYLDRADWHMCRPNDDTALVVAAFDGDRIVGMASADADTELLWSTDVEVLSGYRGHGIAVALTTVLTNTILNRGAVPFATGAWTNNASRATLCRCGYYPAWSGVGSSDERIVIPAGT